MTFFLLFFLSLFSAKAELRIDITQGTVRPIPMGLPDFGGGELGKQISQVVAADLERSGLFRIVDPSSYIQTSDQVLSSPDFAAWKIINAEGLLGGKVVNQGGQVQVEFRLFDVFNNAQKIGFAFQGTEGTWRRIAHKIADQVYEALTGEKGYFDTRIVYVAKSGGRPLKFERYGKAKVHRLAIMDQDGANHQYLTGGESIVLTPRFSPNSHQITYLDYGTRPPSVFLLNLSTGAHRSIGQFQGMTFAPRFTPDGNTLAMSMAYKGVTSLYTMPIGGKKLYQITKTTSSIDTSPSYSPDGAQVVFNSDREGTPQLYIMNRDGSGAKRISFGEGRYFAPVWSPRGDWILFIKKKDRHYIGVMRADGSGERMIASDYIVDNPTFSPNGRVVMFSAKASLDASSKLYTIDLTGNNKREVVTPGEADHPAWSPLLED